MRIAIVDDDAADRRTLHGRLEVQLARHSIHADISEYENGRKFLAEAAQEPFTLVFLDIYMKKDNGIETAKKLRLFDPDCMLVFTTTSAEHALDGFRVRALHYLVKPYSDKDFQELMDEIIDRMPKPDKYIEVRSANGTQRLRFSEIIYAEHYQHQIYTHTTDNRKITTRQTFGKFAEDLQDERFFLCNRGVLANMEHAVDFNGTVFILENEEAITVSRNLRKSARMAFGDFLFKRRGI